MVFALLLLLAIVQVCDDHDDGNDDDVGDNDVGDNDVGVNDHHGGDGDDFNTQSPR